VHRRRCGCGFGGSGEGKGHVVALRLREDAGSASGVKWRRGESRKVAVHGEGPAAMEAVRCARGEEG